MPARRIRWVLLAFRLPRDPSTPRIAVWRKLKRLGAAQLVDGLVALPLDGRNREQFEWVAQEVLEADGEATIWISETATAEEERELIAHMNEVIADDYERLIAETGRALTQPVGRRRRSLARLRREYRRIRERDYFPTPERELAQRAIDELAVAAEDEPARR